MPAKFDPLDIVGKPFSMLTVKEYLGRNDSGHHEYRCVCSCKDATEVIVPRRNLLWNEKWGNGVKSCGCLRRERGYHGKNRTYYTAEMRRAQEMKAQPQVPYKIVRHK